MPLHHCAACLLVCILGLASPLVAAEITVTTISDALGGSPTHCSLREAIEAANTDAAVDGCAAGSGADVILLQPFTTYTLGRAGVNEDDNQTGDLDVKSWITIRGDTVLGSFAHPFIDGDGIDRVLQAHLASYLTIERVKVVGGSAVIGGGILSAGTLELRSAGVSGNSASGSGGGLYLLGGTATIESSLISQNDAGGSGGGTYQDAGHQRLAVRRTTLRANDAATQGGALSAHGLLDLRDSLVVDNEAEYGGGVYLSGDVEQELANTTISGNRARVQGGGLYAHDADPQLAAWLSNLTITDNEADSDASGTGFGGGILGSRSRLANSIVAGNRTLVSGDRPDCSAINLQSLGFNLIGAADSGCVLNESVPTSQVGTTAAPIAPLLDGLEPNGGSTQSHLPLAGSPAIDAGDPAGCRGREGRLWTDQRGYATRYVDGDGDLTGRCDVGAVEVDASDIHLFADGFDSGSACEWSSREGAPLC